LLNLSRNGMQAMRHLGNVDAPRLLTLRVKPAASNAHSKWVEFSVADQGEGISPEVAAQLFTPFFTTRAEGMGLGLSLCRTVIEQHGGYLNFEALLPRGTLFSFTLPVAGRADADLPASQKSIPTAATDNKAETVRQGSLEQPG